MPSPAALPTALTRTPVPSAPVAGVVAFFETLTRANLPRLATLYAPQARFVDPFNDVEGVPAITRIFEHMFDTLHDPRFVVTQVVEQGGQCFLTWEFHFRFRRFSPQQPQCIRGASHLVLDAQGLVSLHRDYWDAAQELYEKLPWVGGLVRWLRRQASR